MSDTSSTFWRPVALFLLVALIGVYLLYEWYDDRLYEQLDTQEQALAEAAGHARQLDVELAEAVSRRDALSLELEQLRLDHDTTLAALEQRLATLRADKEALEQRYQTLHERHQSMAADLDSERAQASGAYAELEARYQQAEATIATLRDDLSRVHEAIAATAAEHRAHIETLERHLNERIHLSTTTPMDAELLRLAQNLGVVPSEADRQAIAELKTKLELLQEDYAAARAKHEADRAHLQQALEQAEARAAAREAELDELKRAYGEALAALEARPSEDGDDDAVARLAELNRTLAEREARIAELEERLVAVGQQRAEASAALAARPSAQQLTELETALAAARTRIEGLEAELTSAAAGAADEAVLREQLMAREARVVELESTLAELEADHQALRAELAAQQARLVEDDAALAAQADDIEIDAQVETLTTALAAERERTAQVRALYQRLAELGASYSEQGMRLRLANDTLRFPTGAATLPADELPVLDQIVALLADNPGLTLRIVGHTDSAGSDALNLELSRQRAEAVRAGLIERGLDPERVEAEGVGEAGPIASNATARGRASNRRVEVYVIE
ncbi:OmpA family protein [Marichromatium bheemlicum]|uniref:OmpA family protein n=1 Tax=Marichromatium bheemlicum TaxID=365339 RepID=A0ABX1I9A2_9GAMM|nr:OmpA family protein [Marichromatium bheemlicum]NKN33818.1 OmpA family protein [Marichromatium bheemlicum]